MIDELIGIIYIPEVFYEDNIGTIDKKTGRYGMLFVRVYSNEGTYPHLHIDNKAKSIDCCVCLHTNKFFTHGTHDSQIHGKLLKVFDSFMRDQYSSKESESITNWDFAWSVWNRSTDPRAHMFKKPEQIPDYANMSGTIQDKE